MALHDKRWQRFWYAAKEWLRFLDRDGLPERLQLSWQDFPLFLREGMWRDTRFTINVCPLGIYKVLGNDAALVSQRVWRPRDFFLMERLSIAYHLIINRLENGVIPSNEHIERLQTLVYQWVLRFGGISTREEINQQILSFVQDHTVSNAHHEDDGPRQINIDHPLLDELYEIEDTIDLHVPGIGNATTFDEIGLMLSEPLGEGRYHCTPINCTVFAHTGGDGTHYSLLQINGTIGENSPVVMTMPSNCDYPRDFIVGETLQDFLCLGVDWGYFALEQIGNRESELTLYLEGQPNATASHLAEITSGMNPTKRKILDLLRARFDLKPWTDPEHWKRLQDKYYPLLQIPPSL